MEPKRKMGPDGDKTKKNRIKQANRMKNKCPNTQVNGGGQLSVFVSITESLGTNFVFRCDFKKKIPCRIRYHK